MTERASFFRTIAEALSGKQHDYTSGSLNRAIVLLAIPMVLEMVMESLFAVVDAFCVSQYLGSAALAAVGLTESVLTLYYAIALGLTMAATALVARRVGEKDFDGAARSGMQGVWLAIVLGIGTGIPVGWLAPDILVLMGAEEAVLEVGSNYARILFGGNVVILLLFLNNAIFRGAGDPAYAMRALWLANGINIVLDPCLILGLGPFPELGLTGAAVATTTGRGIGVLYQTWLLRSGKSRVALRGDAVRIRVREMVALVKTSVGGIGQMLIATTSWVALMRIMSPFGEVALAGYTLAVRILIFTILPAWGLANAAATLVGQNLGAKRADRAERAVWLTGFYNMAFLGVVMVVFLLLGPPIVALFGPSHETATVATEALRVICYGYIAYAWGMVLTQAFNGAGDTMTPTAINGICFWIVQVPLAYLLARGAGFGPSGVFWSIAASETLLAAVALVWFRRGRWRRHAV